MVKIILIVISLYCISFAKDYYYSNGSKIYITPSNFRNLSNRVYIDENEQKIILTDNILVKIKNSVDLVKLQNEFNIEIIKSYSNNLYLVRAKGAVLETANRLYEDERTIFSHPDFIRKMRKR